MSTIPQDPCRALAKLFSKLDEQDKDTLNWLIESAVYVSKMTEPKTNEELEKFLDEQARQLRVSLALLEGSIGGDLSNWKQAADMLDQCAFARRKAGQGREAALMEVLALPKFSIKIDGSEYETETGYARYIKIEAIRALLHQAEPAKEEGEADMDSLLLNALHQARDHLLRFGVAHGNTENVLLGAMGAVEELKRLRNKPANGEGETPEPIVSVKVKHLMAIQDALVNSDPTEAYHWLYQIAHEQAADAYHPWAEFKAALQAHKFVSPSSAEWLRQKATAFNLAYIKHDLLKCADEIDGLESRIKELETQLRDRSDLGVR